jgi:hypothetical protein
MTNNVVDLGLDRILRYGDLRYLPYNIQPALLITFIADLQNRTIPAETMSFNAIRRGAKGAGDEVLRTKQRRPTSWNRRFSIVTGYATQQSNRSSQWKQPLASDFPMRTASRPPAGLRLLLDRAELGVPATWGLGNCWPVATAPTSNTFHRTVQLKLGDRENSR